MLERILVVETSFPGDAVIATAVAEEIKRLQPSTHVTYLVRPEVADLLRMARSIDEVRVFDKYGKDSGRSGIERVARELNEGKYVAAFVLNPSTRNRALIDQSHIPIVRFLDGRNPTGKRRSEILLSILLRDFPDTLTNTLPHLSPKKSQRELPSEYVAIAPGSAWATKCWPAKRFQALASAFERQSVASVVIGGKDDRPRGMIVADGNLLSKDLTGITTLAEAASIIAGAKLLIANDSAPVHIATAVRTPVVAIFGPTVPEFGFAPPIEIGRVVQTDLWCRPCTSHGPDQCPIHTHECMKRISVEQVMEVASTLIRVAI